MIIPRPEDAKHKIQMYRLLREILKINQLANDLVFKGGTCAVLRGVLDRFSVDLDFDLPDNSRKDDIREICHDIFKKLDLVIKDESKNHLQFFLKYDSDDYARNTLKLEINDQVSKYAEYETIHLKEVDMYARVQTLDTMFASKLIAAKARFTKNGKIAGRDFYDIHKFFVNGLTINTKIVEERTGMKYEQYLQDFISFVTTEVNKENLYEDLNILLRPEALKISVENLKDELLLLLRDELSRQVGP